MAQAGGGDTGLDGVVLLPGPTIARPYMLRGFRLWVLVRALLVLVLALADGDPFKLGFSTTVALLSLVVLVGFIDTYRHHERAFLSNIGVGQFGLAMLYLLPCLAAEASLRILVALA